MSSATELIQFEHLGIGRALSNNQLRVPVNQREYRWTDDEVKELIQDFHRAITQGAYFLGTVVLTRGKGSTLEVADGQQRLATVTILLAAIRDAFHARGDTMNVEYVENDFLSRIDPRARKRVPRLSLNVDDHEFFRKAVLSLPGDEDRKVEPTRESHRRILKARDLARKHAQTILQGHSDAAKSEALLHWIEFITNGAQVILLTVPDHLNAFRMFETLNDRGLKTSQSDLLKNYLFGEAGARIEEAQHKWSAMAATIESVGEDDLLMTYLRHLLVTRYGAIREREVYDRIKGEVRGTFPSIQFLEDLAENANYYVALMNKHHPYWGSCGTHSGRIRRSVETLNELNVGQIRPLMLACVRAFSPAEVEKVFRLFISWSVRYAITGTPTGVVEKYYAARAKEVNEGEIKKAADLTRQMNKHLPSDEAFRGAFEAARVSKSYFARYLLRSLEQKAKNDPEPEFVVNDDQTVLTLEHVLPQQPGDGWNHVDQEAAEILHRRLGNMILLRASTNSKLGNVSFAEKKKVYKASSNLELTKPVLRFDQWGQKEINERQAKLAKAAVETWPLDVR